MDAHVDVIAGLMSAVDSQDWDKLGLYLDPDVVYNRPGFEPMTGLSEVLRFYREIRQIAAGTHTLEKVLADEAQGCCWGRLDGTTRAGDAISEQFAEWYGFNRRVLIVSRRTFFYRPAI